MAGPLDGVRVVELGVWVAGPAAGGVLADWGADVVKIEPPSGDPARMFGRMLGIEDGLSPPFEMDNRGKRSIVLDVTTEDGRATTRELLSDADVFLTNVRPAALTRMGLDFAAVAEQNPRLVYGLITGYGESGPDADRAAYDVAAFWARSGLAHLLTRPGETPPFQRGGMGDHMAGMTLAGAVCAALVARGRTGKGQLVSTSLYRQGAYTVSFDLNTFLMTGQPIAIGQRESMGNPCMNNYAAGDGRRFWIVGLEAGRHWPPLCRAVGRADWLTDPASRHRMPGPSTRENSSPNWTRSLRPNRSTSGRKSLRANRISSGRRSTPSRTYSATSNSTPQVASSTFPTGTPQCRWSPRLRTSTARRGNRTRGHRNSASTPPRCSPN